MIDIELQRSAFDPIERAILSDYFGMAREEDIRDIDILAANDDRDASTGGRRIRIEPDSNGNIGDHTIGNAVARLAIDGIQKRLPQWFAGYGDGRYILGRDLRPKTRRDVHLKPVHLFTINWADSAPGYSWPVAYYLSWIPGFDRFVITSSADSPDADGYADLSIGHFPGSTPVLDGCREVLTAYWTAMAHYQCKWQHFLEDGLIDNFTVDQWVEGILRSADEW